MKIAIVEAEELDELSLVRAPGLVFRLATVLGAVQELLRRGQKAGGHLEPDVDHLTLEAWEGHRNGAGAPASS